MKQKLIQEVMFIFFIFVFSIVKSEGPKIKLIKIKEFSSYEEYERWKGKVRKPPRIIVDKGVIKFYDSKGRVIKQKIYKYLSKKDREKIIEKQTKSLIDEKGISIYYEDAKILPNEKGILLEKTTSYYEGWESNYEIYDENGNKIGEINENVDVYPSPDSEYFVCLYRGIYDVSGDIAFFSKNGKLLSKSKVFDFIGSGKNVIFSPDGEYVIFTLNEFSKSGVSFLKKSGEILKIIVSDNWCFPLGNRFIIYKNEWIIFPSEILSETERYSALESYTFRGDLMWKYIVGRYKDIKYSFDGKDTLTVIDFPLTRIGELPTNFTLHFIDVNNGILKEKRSFSNNFLGRPICLTTSFENNFILLYSIKNVSADKIIRMIHLLDKNGDILWSKEYEDVDVDAYFDEDGRVILKEGEKVFLYEVKVIKE